MNTNTPKKNDHHDRLLDTALREVVGQETPPDLSKKILAAASEQSQPLVNLGDDAMTSQQPSRRKRNVLIGTVLAASLLVGSSLLFPERMKQSSRIVARSENSTPAVKTEIVQDAEQKKKPVGTTVELPEFEVISVETTISVPDGGTVIAGGKKRLQDVREKSKETNGKSKTSDDLMMGVTPHIIIQKGERGRPGLSAQGDRKQTPPAKASGEPGQKELQGLINDNFSTPSSSPLPDFTVDLDRPFRRSSFGLTVPQFGGPAHGKDGRTSEPGDLALSERKARQRSRRVETSSLFAREQGQGPDASGDQYTRIYENPFIAAEGEQAVSTFSIDVDTASYANVRQFLMQAGQLPPVDAVRIEELVNYFDYDYTTPTGDTPFAAHVEIAGCPWQAEHRLVRVGIKGREIATDRRPQSNLVFLIDVSGSMNQPAKLPLLVEGMKLLTRELGENDRVAIVVYASSEGLALPSTRGDQQDTILASLENLRAGGSTAGGAGIELAYKIAKENFIQGGVNRVILATDGDFNVGVTNPGDLERLAESNAKETGVFLTVLGFGRGNLNDSMMEAISGKGNGNYHYVDNRAEANKVLVAEMAGTLVTIAKDVKIQIEFNPAQVAAYRLIGYENRMLETQDFNDDKKDAGEIGASHTVTAIYEVVPAAIKSEIPKVKTPKVASLKYQLRAEAAPPANNAANNDELLTLKLRYKQPDGDRSTKLEFPITDNGQPFAEATDDFKFASAVASFGMLLRNSEHRGNTSYDSVLEIAEEGAGKDRHGYRAEFLQMVRRAKELAAE